VFVHVGRVDIFIRMAIACGPQTPDFYVYRKSLQHVVQSASGLREF